MFISKAEKEDLRFRLLELEEMIDNLRVEVRLKNAGQPAQGRSAESRALQSRRMKAYWTARKAREAAQ